MTATPSARPPLPPFTRETAVQKVRAAEDAWNTRDPERIALAYTPDSRWRNRAEFLAGRDEIVQFLRRKWVRELDYRLVKELWAHHGDRSPTPRTPRVHPRAAAPRHRCCSGPLRRRRRQA